MEYVVPKLEDVKKEVHASMESILSARTKRRMEISREVKEGAADTLKRINEEINKSLFAHGYYATKSVETLIHDAANGKPYSILVFGKAITEHGNIEEEIIRDMRNENISEECLDKEFVAQALAEEIKELMNAYKTQGYICDCEPYGITAVSFLVRLPKENEFESFTEKWKERKSTHEDDKIMGRKPANVPFAFSGRR